MRTITYAIGDVHGRDDLLSAMLDRIEADAGERNAAATIVFTGDYVDRGADTRGVVQRVIDGPRRPGDRFVPLRGNHDDLFARAVRGDVDVPDWAWQLHRHALQSYGGDLETLRRHAGFLARLPLTYDDGANLFVHAGIRPGVPLDAQAEQDLLWIRAEFLDHPGPLPRRVVHGHTIVGEVPVVTAHRVSIDTGAYKSGRLTAAVFDGGVPRFLQAVGEPDRGAIVREALLSAALAGRSVSPAMQAAFDDFTAGRIDVGEMEMRTRRAAA